MRWQLWVGNFGGEEKGVVDGIMKEYYVLQRQHRFYSAIKLLMAFFLVFYADQKPLDLAQGAEVKHILVGNKVCSNGLHLTSSFLEKNCNS